MSALRLITGLLWQSEHFRLLVVVLVRKYPGQVATWLAVNTPLLLALHKLFLEAGDFEYAARIVADLRQHRGAWSL